ncbi:M28 family peptidase [Brevibacillus invocatus]|uniref:M28 family peptidase n=1 Tax=Brevibacillus invocatus TaxID=173959 RepID=UPI00203D61BD|nr:M28 family peptidase [Brevibacillus invocatus]MCM3078346.1 M28 family peptidase [Brevibacillus invocatus]MCM3428499.1 M28 family peptidase [Brevibacillus invocatus]
MSYLKKAVLLFFFIGVAVVSILQTQPPVPLSQAADHSFSAQRAYAILQEIARAPHPTGSAENDRVREYIVSEAERWGYKPEIQVAEYALTGANRNLVTSATLHNIVVRVPGASSSKAILVSAHYDSAIGSPGANDNGVAVAAILETMRALTYLEPLKNDVIFLFSDGEELDLLGARAFWRDHPWAKDVGMVLNYESKGSSGPSMMFETGKQNGWLIQQMALALPHPVTNSSMSNAYEILNNDTDFTIAREQGVIGLNFAYGEGGYTYHIALDDLEHVNMRSLQHQGENVFESIVHFGHADLLEIKGPDRIYFSMLNQVISYPKTWSIVIALLITAVIVYTLIRRRKAQCLQWKSLGKAILLILGGLAGTWAMMYAIWSAVTMFWTTDMLLYRIEWMAAAMLLLILALISCTFPILQRWADLRHMHAAGVLISLLLLWLTTLYLPGASFFFVFPFLLHYALFVFGKESEREGERGWLLHAASAALVGWFFLPFLFILIHFLPLVFMPVLFTLFVLIGFWMYPSLLVLVNQGSRLIALGLVVLSVVLLGSFHYQTQPSADTPELNNLFFVENADTGSSYWVSRTGPDAWISTILQQPHETNLNDFIIDGGRERRVWVEEANYQALSSPQLSVLQDEKDGEYRTVELLLNTGRGAKDYIMLEVVDADVEEVQINGNAPDYRYAEQRNWNWRVRYYQVPVEGLRVTLRLKTTTPTAPVSLRLMDGSYGLPTGEQVASRPAEMIGGYEYDNMTLVMKSYMLP